MLNLLKIAGVFTATSLSAILTSYSISGIDKNLIVFSFDGSSSMKPFMEHLMKNYIKTHSNVIYNISVVGSNIGLMKLINKSTDFALVSHDISHIPREPYKDQWSENKLKHIPIAKENIVILYKAPEGCEGNFVLNKDNVHKFYSLFSGHKYPNESDYQNLKSYLNNNSKCDVILSPWVKNIGPTKSGTAKAFIDNPLLKNYCDSKTTDKTECEKWLTDVKDGYGYESKLRFTPEPINLHWNNFFLNMSPGSITYFPSSFVLTNWEVIESNNIKVVSFKESDSEISLNKENYQNVDNSYSWGRVFNLIYSVEDSTSQPKKELIEYLVQNLNYLSSYYLKTYKYKLSSSSSLSSSSQSTSTDTKEIDISKEDEVSQIWKDN